MFDGEWLLLFSDEVIDLRTAARKSRVKVWTLSVKVSKDSAPYGPSISTSVGKWLL